MSVVPSCLCLPSSIIKRKSGGFLRNFCTPINTTIANVQISEAETILAPQTEEQWYGEYCLHDRCLKNIKLSLAL
jgi:hypothetical protein